MTESDRNSNCSKRKSCLFQKSISNLFVPQEYTPRISIFVITIVIKLGASAVSGIAYVFNNSILYISGIMLWLLWFAFLFIIAVPETDQWLQNSSERLKKIAQKIIIVVLVIGIVEFIGLSIIGLDTLGLKEKEQ